jgi:hypothetical protein
MAVDFLSCKERTRHVNSGLSKQSILYLAPLTYLTSILSCYRYLPSQSSSPDFAVIEGLPISFSNANIKNGYRPIHRLVFARIMGWQRYFLVTQRNSVFNILEVYASPDAEGATLKH